MVGPVDLNQSVASVASSPSNLSVDDSSIKKELSDLSGPLHMLVSRLYSPWVLTLCLLNLYLQ